MGARELGAFGGALPEASGAYGFNPPELRTYQPSWRDRIALALQNVLPEQTVEGLMGSRGLGPTQRNAGMGLVDFTPAGIPLAVNEAQRSGEEGDWLGATVNAMAMVPGAKAGTKAIEAGVNEVRQGIRAYHGSPHDFDKFDLSKIGTGEGAQAYGHGLYFAENEGVARDYKTRLAPLANVSASGAPITKADIRAIADELGMEQAAGTASNMFGRLSKSDSVDDYLAKLAEIDTAQLTSFPKVITEVENEKRLVAELKARGLDIDRPNKGKMYEVSINANPDEFLDWDKPLSEQPEAVRKALRYQIDPETADRIAYLDREIDGMRRYLPTMNGNERSYGERQLKYMMEERASLDPSGGEYLRTSGGLGDNSEDITNSLRDAGIKGIRYKDAGSRGTDKAGGTSNYVVFSDDLITILRKYGLAGLTVGGVAGMAAGMPRDAQAKPSLYDVGGR